MKQIYERKGNPSILGREIPFKVKTVLLGTLTSENVNSGFYLFWILSQQVQLSLLESGFLFNLILFHMHDPAQKTENNISS